MFLISSTFYFSPFGVGIGRGGFALAWQLHQLLRTYFIGKIERNCVHMEDIYLIILCINSIPSVSLNVLLQDTVVGGRITFNVPEKEMEYRKKFNLPNGTNLVCTGSCRFADRSLQRYFGVQLEWGGANQTPTGRTMHGHSNAVWAGSGFDMRQKFCIISGLNIEVAGYATLPTPSARYSSNTGTLGLGEGAFHLHVAEVNAILKV